MMNVSRKNGGNVVNNVNVVSARAVSYLPPYPYYPPYIHGLTGGAHSFRELEF